MDKVKLPREIAEEIRYIYERTDGRWDLMRVCLSTPKIKEYVKKEGLVKLAQAIEYGFEVEEAFKVGDWVTLTTGPGLTKQLEKIDESDERKRYWGYWSGDMAPMTWLSGIYMRLATPEEIEAEQKRRADEKKKKFWSDLGREVDEYRVGDVVEYAHFVVSINKVEEGLTFKDCSLVRVENSEGLATTSARNIRLICPVERRLDKEGN